MIAFLIAFLLSLFASLIQQLIPQVDAIDKIIAVVFAVSAIAKLAYLETKQRFTLRPSDIGLLAISIIFIIYCFIPNMFHQPSNTMFLQIYSMFSILKFVIVFWSGLFLFRNTKFKTSTLFFRRMSTTLTTIFLIIGVLNIPLHFLEPFDVRFGIETVSFGFRHPAQFAATIIVITIVHIFITWSEKGKMPYYIIFANFILVFLAGRTTSIGFYLCLILLILIFPYIKRIPIYIYAIVGAVFYWLGSDRISNQFLGTDGEARGVLLDTSLTIASEHAPFGAGLGMFGSNASRLNYSPLYEQYGISRVWGLTQENPNFVTDSYWAMIIGELGYLGMFFIIVIIGYIFWLLYKEIVGSTYQIKFLIFLPIVYALMTSPIDTVLVSNTSIFLVLATIYMVALNNEYRSQK
ncbi:hypothetical protein HCJ39_08465 [Listeria rocourtiae]|uniref:hypothetical protein n=1 Tax=Listeria rocourtiae TaxID=647910 RepID=UPI0016271E79|nr:hypothetical protein [Listeria rocourtiae]MBC1604742.1 hypothetical protein [Listeria rocourtiae]